jgi:peptide/nickel transport system substrate-binding protein
MEEDARTRRNSMKKFKSLAVIAACFLLTSVFAVIPVFSAQPPIDTSHMYVGTIGQPKNVDPSQAYDTASGELIMNVYDSILEFGSQGTNVTNKPTFTVPANGSVNVGTHEAVLGAATDIPGVGYMPVVTDYGNGTTLWTFKVNTNLVFQDWKLPNGTTVTGEHISQQDVVYYFRRFLVQDSHNSPEWMIITPAFGIGAGSFDNYQIGSGPSMTPANETYVASLIMNFVSGFTNSTGNYVQFLFLYPAAGLYDIFCQTWSSIPPMQWSIDHGCWNGTFYTGWSTDFRRYPNDQFTPLDVHTTAHGSATGSLYGASAEPAMCGTGPYKFTYWNQATNEWRIDAFPGCVSHPWPGPYGAGSPAPTTVVETGIDTWPTRKMEFLAGDSDMSAVNRANMYDLLQSTSQPYSPISGIDLYYNIPALVTYAIFFEFNVSAGSKWIPTVTFANGTTAPDPKFFSDIHVRWAFCQALNMSAYISEAWHNEALHPSTWWCLGLTPTDGYNTGLKPWDINEAAVYGNLTAAGITGFNITLLYNIGNDQRRIAAQEISDAFNTINTIYGSHYYISVVGEDWPVYLADSESGNLPLFSNGWLADFSDADDFAVPFMATGGAFPYWQAYGNSTIDSQVQAEEALAAAPYNTTAGSAYENRSAIFKTLQYEYYQQAISLGTVQPIGRHWQRDWVNGYYVNTLYPGFYYQDLYKSAPTTYQPVDVEVTAITLMTAYPRVYISMGQMKQLYAGGAPATMTFQVHVKRNDANTNVTSLTVAVGLERFNLTALSAAVPVVNPLSPAYPASTIVLLAPGGEWTGVLTWYEDGKGSTCQANATWEIAAYVAVVAPTTAEDNNTANNFADSGFNSTALTSWNATTRNYYLIPGDLNGDGIVNILDSIVFMNCFGKSSGQLGYNQAADLNGDGVVDILDAILFANHLGQKAVTDP